MPEPALDIAHFRDCGWLGIRNAVPGELCERLVAVLESELRVPVRDPSRWDEYGGPMRDLLPVWGHQAQWDIRQHPALHRIWATLWKTKALCVSLDSCRFTPPWKSAHGEPYGLHWDQNPWDAKISILQGVLALTDTAVGQGGFRCAPSLYANREAWPRTPRVDADGEENWLADVAEDQIVSVPAAAGDLIVWDYRLPHSNSKNISVLPRLAFYLAMYPAGDEALRLANVESWRTGRCVPWWRSRQGMTGSSLGRRPPSAISAVVCWDWSAGSHDVQRRRAAIEMAWKNGSTGASNTTRESRNHESGFRRPLLEGCDPPRSDGALFEISAQDLRRSGAGLGRHRSL